MSFSFGGLIIKSASDLTDEQLLFELGKNSYSQDIKKLTTHEATSRELEGLAILRKNETVILLSRDLPYGCSFDAKEPSKLDQKLSEISKKKEILCFTLNGTAETYAFALFAKGQLVRARSVSAGKELSNAGKQTPYESADTLNESGMVSLIERFSGISFSGLMNDRTRSVNVFTNLI